MALLGAAFMFTAPAHAHGNEKHGEKAAAPAGTPADTAPGQEGEETAHERTAPGAMQSANGAAAASDHGSADHHAWNEPNAGMDHDATEESAGGIVGVLKNLHPAMVHFPIALFLMAALTELVAIRRPSQPSSQPSSQGLTSAVRVMIYGGAAGGVVAALFGWIHTGLWFGGNTTMQVHRWNGTALSVAGLVLAAVAAKAGANRTLLRVLLFGVAFALIVQGYFGGELADGPNHLGF